MESESSKNQELNDFYKSLKERVINVNVNTNVNIDTI